MRADGTTRSGRPAGPETHRDVRSHGRGRLSTCVDPRRPIGAARPATTEPLAPDHRSDDQPSSIDGRAGTERHVLIVDEVRLTREGLAELLTRRGLTANGCGSTTAAVRDGLDRHSPDVVMLNAATVDVVGVATVIRRSSAAAVVAIGVVERADDVVRCAAARLAGFTMASEPIDALIELIHTADAARAQCPAAAVPMLIAAISEGAADLGRAHLTPREREIVELIAQGLANKEIASRLGITSRTVKNHLHHAYAKLDVHSRTEAAAVLRASDGRGDPAGY